MDIFIKPIFLEPRSPYNTGAAKYWHEK